MAEVIELSETSSQVRPHDYSMIRAVSIILNQIAYYVLRIHAPLLGRVMIF